jgi:lysyl-tRNA synthetase, class II
MENPRDHLEHEAQENASGEHKIRLEKVAALEKKGISVWPEAKSVDSTAHDVLADFPLRQAQGDRDEVGGSYTLAGRLVARRGHGKTAFGRIQDRSGALQIYIKEDTVGEELFKMFEHAIDLGDIIWVSGSSFKTKTGEITLKVDSFTLLSKCLYPLPEKFHGLVDVETKYRQRYLDLISNKDSRDRFRRRSEIIRAMRVFFDQHDFLEVETPMLHPIPGGAAARPFITHHNALDAELYLRIAPELFLKRLVVGGFERVYEINRNFRNEGISTRHNPEFTMVEFYIAHHDYHFMMDFIEELFREIVKKSCDSMQVPFGDLIIDFEKPFARLTMKDAVIEYGDCSEDQLSEANIDKTLAARSVKLENSNPSWGAKLFALFEAFVEPNLKQPTFILGYPIEISPLAKRDTKNTAIAARFEMFIAGMEISNGFNELNDPFDQAERFKQQVQARTTGDSEAHHYDAEFIHALEYGLPPTVGAGIGIDRLVMLLTNTTSIKDVILFPTLKRKES